MMRHPTRTIERWTEEPNPEPVMVERFPTVWFALLSCAHRINFGGGAKPNMHQVACVHCKPIEPEAA
jgi:hypothetical protein